MHVLYIFDIFFFKERKERREGGQEGRRGKKEGGRGKRVGRQVGRWAHRLSQHGSHGLSALSALPGTHSPRQASLHLPAALHYD